MRWMILARTMAALALLLAASSVSALDGITIGYHDMRSGPSKRYPLMYALTSLETVTIHGCTANLQWCDVNVYDHIRGWAAASCLQVIHQGRRVLLADHVRQGHIVPVLGFDIDQYWRQNYQERSDIYPRIAAYRALDWASDPPLPDCDRVTP